MYLPSGHVVYVGTVSLAAAAGASSERLTGAARPAQSTLRGLDTSQSEYGWADRGRPQQTLLLRSVTPPSSPSPPPTLSTCSGSPS